MGNYFVMSTMFNKNNACDFGLVPIDENYAINPIDNSLWHKCSLYDLGWGKENGFYKEPIPGFDVLFQIVLCSTDKEDIYGAAAIILDNFVDDLLSQCELIMYDPKRQREFKILVDLFNLKVPLNRLSVTGKSYEQIQDDYERWKIVSEAAKKNNSTRRFFKKGKLIR